MRRPPHPSRGPRRRHRAGRGRGRGTPSRSAPNEVGGGPAPGRHQGRQRGVVVVQRGQPGPLGHREDEVIVPCVRDMRRVARVEIRAVPAQRGQRGVEFAGLGRAGARGHAGQRRGQPRRCGRGRDRDRPGEGVELHDPRSVALGEGHRGSDRGVAAERHLGLWAEIPDPVLSRPHRPLRRTRSRSSRSGRPRPGGRRRPNRSRRAPRPPGCRRAQTR